MLSKSLWAPCNRIQTLIPVSSTLVLLQCFKIYEYNVRLSWFDRVSFPPIVWNYNVLFSILRMLVQICIATQDGSEVKTYSIKLAKGERDRIGEDTVASRLLLKALAKSCQLTDSSNTADLGLKVHGENETASEVLEVPFSSLPCLSSTWNTQSVFLKQDIPEVSVFLTSIPTQYRISNHVKPMSSFAKFQLEKQSSTYFSSLYETLHLVILETTRFRKLT